MTLKKSIVLTLYQGSGAARDLVLLGHSLGGIVIKAVCHKFHYKTYKT